MDNESLLPSYLSLSLFLFILLGPVLDNLAESKQTIIRSTHPAQSAYQTLPRWGRELTHAKRHSLPRSPNFIFGTFHFLRKVLSAILATSNLLTEHRTSLNDSRRRRPLTCVASSQLKITLNLSMTLSVTLFWPHVAYLSSFFFDIIFLLIKRYLQVALKGTQMCHIWSKQSH